MSNYVELIAPKRANSSAHFCGTLRTNSKLCLLFIWHDLTFLCVIACNKRRRDCLTILSRHEKISQQIKLLRFLVKEVEIIVMCPLPHEF